jgi:hypothetical protein
MDVSGQETSQPTRPHSGDVHRLTCQQDGDLLANGNRVARLGKSPPEVLLQDECKINMFIQPPRVYRKSQIIATGYVDSGPESASLLWVGLSPND